MLRCTGEAFGELFLAMTDNLSSKCFAPTNHCTGEALGELFLAMTDNLSSKCFAVRAKHLENYFWQ
jgi:hypothetical protein